MQAKALSFFVVKAIGLYEYHMMTRNKALVLVPHFCSLHKSSGRDKNNNILQIFHSNYQAQTLTVHLPAPRSFLLTAITKQITNTCTYLYLKENV